MAKYKSIVITNAGLELVAAAHSGDVIEFTGIKTGNGTYDGSEVLADMTGLKSLKQSFGITGLTSAGAVVKVRSALTNNNLATGYHITEIGLYAMDPSTSTEILYAIAVAESGMEDYLPAYADSPQSITLEIYIEATGAENVSFTASVIPGIYVTVEDFNDVTTEINNRINTVNTKANETSDNLDAHTDNKNNPHAVTKEQVGLGNVDNVTTNDQKPTYTEATNLEKLTSGEKLSVAFGKIAKAVSSLISHLANKNNPHEVTKAQLGLENVDNTADLDKPISTAVQNEIDRINQAIIDVDALNEADGSPILLTDTAEGNLSDFKLYGRSTQDGEPTPDNPIAIKSVGTFDGELLQGYYNEGGAFVSTIQYLCSKNMIACNSGDTVKLMYGADMNSACFVFYDENMNVVGRPSEVSTITEFNAVAPTNTRYMHFLLRDARGEVTPSNAKAIIVTINDKQVITVKSCGKNLWEFGDQSFTTNSSTLYKTLKAGTYTISAVVTSSGTDGTKSAIYFYNDNIAVKGVPLQRNSRNSYTFTLDTDVNKLMLYAETDQPTSVGDTATWSDIQLEFGDTATEYEPYTENVNTIALSEPLKSANNLTDEVSPTEITRRFTEIVIDGVNLTMTSADSNIAFITLENIGNSAICSHFTYHADSRIGDNQSAGLILTDGEFCIRTTVHDRIYFKNSNFTTVDEWNTWLQAKPMTVVCELAEPVVETIEPVDVTTYNNVTYITATDNADMWVEYYSNSNVGRRLAHTNGEMKAEHERLQEQITATNEHLAPIKAGNTTQVCKSGNVVIVHFNSVSTKNDGTLGWVLDTDLFDSYAPLDSSLNMEFMVTFRNSDTNSIYSAKANIVYSGSKYYLQVTPMVNGSLLDPAEGIVNGTIMYMTL